MTLAFSFSTRGYGAQVIACQAARVVAFALLSSSGFAAGFDHVGAIQALTEADLARGQKLYSQHCVACHGADGNLTQNPLARSFVKDELKFGADPYALWKTVSYGNGLMFRWDAVLTEAQRYQVVHYIREAFLRRNGEQYQVPNADYFAALPTRVDVDARAHGQAMPEVVPTPGMLDGKMGRATIYGPAQSHSIAFQRDENQNAVRFNGTTEKAMVIGLKGGAALCYDIARMSLAGFWSQKLVAIDETHHSSYKGERGLAPGGTPLYVDVGAVGWRKAGADSPAQPVFHGHYLHGEDVVLAYTIADRRVWELPGGELVHALYSRTFEMSPGKDAVECLVGRTNAGKVNISGSSARIESGQQSFYATFDGDGAGLFFRGDDSGALWLSIPASSEVRRFTVRFGSGEPLPGVKLPPTREVTALTRGGPRRWPEVVKTSIVPGKSVDGYAADEFLVPFANPRGSWMRLTALDFFSDGRIAVSTLSGDVWIVTVRGEELLWSRFANGLYEPLGLRIVNDTIHVRCRDRIVRLNDLNGDGEADFYETFYNEPGEIGAGYHAFIFELQTDRAGNFYYSKSGRKSPHKAAIVRVAPDGSHAETIAGDMRHPNGLGSGGPRDWITVADNPSGKAVFNGVALVRDGVSLGYEKPRTTPMLAVLPASVDASSTGQSWSDEKRWGPLGGALLHTSYSHCAMFYIMVQDVGAHPNGFAVRLPFGFKAGLMRSRTNPADGQVYAVGLKGWDTHAAYDGCLYRIRYTGETTRMVRNVEATRAGLRLTFACDLDPHGLGPKAVTAAREVGKKGEMAPFAVGAIRVVTPRILEIELPRIDDERVELRTSTDGSGNASVEVRPPITLTIAVKSADGHAINQIVYATINSLP